MLDLLCNFVLAQYTGYDPGFLDALVDEGVPALTEDRRTAQECILGKVAEGNGCMVFLDAPGGTGNMYVITLLLARVDGWCDSTWFRPVISAKHCLWFQEGTSADEIFASIKSSYFWQTVYKYNLITNIHV